MLVRQLLSIPGRTWWLYRKWALAHFFYDETRVGDPLSELAAEIEARLATAEPQVEVLLVEVVSGDTLRLFIDHPDGVTLVLCERVTSALADYRDRYALEVSSPGEDRPLSKPQHFSRFLGRHARLRLQDAHEGNKSLTGELVGASENEVTIAACDAIVTVPYDQIARSNLLPGD
jgi:ribosome maturation factor RimP